MSVLRNSEVSATQGVKCITCIRDQSVPKRYVPNSAVSATQGFRKSNPMKSTKVQNPRCIRRIQANNARLLATHRGAAVLPRSVLAATQASSIMHS